MNVALHTSPDMNMIATDADGARLIDLATSPVRALNGALHALGTTNETLWRVANPRGLHAIAAGVDAPVAIEIAGNVGYYCGGMNKQARIVIDGNAGVGVGENMMSGFIHVKGDASQAAGATGCGGLLVIDGNASARCGISMKGIDIVVKGSIGHMSAFMAQAGSLVVFGDAGEALGDSLYEAKLFVRGSVASLGADCIEKEMREEHRALLAARLEAAGALGQVDIGEFRRYGSARTLYHFHVDNVSSY
ncbi:protein glxC [Ancylobacter lacus]|nr:protein glxC [Ancylobacter lacus]